MKRLVNLLFLVTLLFGQKGELVIVISVDQMRGDYPKRFASIWREDGFQRFFIQGVYFSQCVYEHANNMTGPGHACISTGTYPYQHGVTGNEVYENGHYTYCVSDSAYSLLKDPHRGFSPRRLLKPTIGDLLRQHHPNAKVVSIALKDRVAILLGGEKPTYAIWFDSKIGEFTTSSYYNSPKWLQLQKKWGLYHSHIGKKWELCAQPVFTLPPDVQPWEPQEKQRFPHPINTPKDYLTSPFAIADLLELAKKAIDYEKLGKRNAIDFLFIGISSTDYVGHIFGPDSRETYEMYFVIDSLLAQFFQWLDKQSLSYKAILTSDHGVCPIPEHLQYLYVSTAYKHHPDSILHHLNQVISKKFQLKNPFFQDFLPPYLYVSPWGKTLPNYQIILDFAANYLAQNHPAVLAVYTRHQMEQSLASLSSIQDTLLKAILYDFHPREFGDLYVLVKPYCLIDRYYTTTHGTPYWYDAHVPLAFYWKGIKPKVISNRVTPVDLFPTLCEWLKLPIPEYLDGHSLLPYLSDHSTKKKAEVENDVQ